MRKDKDESQRRVAAKNSFVGAGLVSTASCGGKISCGSSSRSHASSVTATTIATAVVTATTPITTMITSSHPSASR